MKFVKTAIADVVVLEPEVFGDDRGFFMETFRQSDFEKHCSKKPFVQDNHSRSAQGTLRGLHYQVQHTQGKLVRVTQGEIFDVAVDLRRSSNTFGQWVSVILSEQNKHQLWVPEGFAHGFYVTSPSAEVIYKCTDYYAPEFDRSLLWNDPQLDIQWPLINQQAPLLSEKDQYGTGFEEVEYFE